MTKILTKKLLVTLEQKLTEKIYNLEPLPPIAVLKYALSRDFYVASLAPVNSGWQSYKNKHISYLVNFCAKVLKVLSGE